MKLMKGKVAWVTGAGTGIGEAGAIGLAAEGAHVVLSGRRAAPLETVAKRIAEDGGSAEVLAVDLTKASEVEKAVANIKQKHGRIDVLVNNAGVNIPDRSWHRISPDGIDTLIHGNLSSAAYVARAVLPVMRAQKDGLIIHTASWAGRYVGPVPGPLYIAAKHGVVAMSHSINLEECQHGIRSTVVCPGEVATPIMQQRDPPEPPEALARMLQSEDLGNLIVYLAMQPQHVCINEVVISPTHSRGYIGQ
ncbi:MAG: SDR family oxidoreductase, partial [Hyphomicrobium sp.]|nr:SDR family oxidoreductase [Hyphomicrobium sp.]